MALVVAEQTPEPELKTDEDRQLYADCKRCAAQLGLTGDQAAEEARRQWWAAKRVRAEAEREAVLRAAVATCHERYQGAVAWRQARADEVRQELAAVVGKLLTAAPTDPSRAGLVARHTSLSAELAAVEAELAELEARRRPWRGWQVFEGVV